MTQGTTFPNVPTLSSGQSFSTRRIVERCRGYIRSKNRIDRWYAALPLAEKARYIFNFFIFFGFVAFNIILLNGALYKNELVILSSPLLEKILQSFTKLEDIPPRLLLAEFTSELEELASHIESIPFGTPDLPWKRLNPKCTGTIYYTSKEMNNNINNSNNKKKKIQLPDPFPPSFDPLLYSELNTLKDGTDSKLLKQDHYDSVGRDLGLVCSRGQRIRDIINAEIVPKLAGPGFGRILEIGPFMNPMLLNSIVPRINNEPLYTIEYFDVLDSDEMKRKARKLNLYVNPEFSQTPIDYVDSHGNLLNVIKNPTEYSLIVSSFTINQQIDLVDHLQQISYLLQNGAYYVLVVPDKRYMFDHYLPETSVADVISDFIEIRDDDQLVRPVQHKLSSIIEHRALTGHSDAERYWQGLSGRQYQPQILDRVKLAIQEYEHYIQDGKYLEVHNYKFTPQGLAFIIDTLFELELTDLHVHRLYETVHGSNEFTIVLKRCVRPLN